MQYITGSCDEVLQRLMAEESLYDNVEMIASSDIIKTFMKKLIMADYVLIRCTLSEDDNWYYLSLENGEMEVGEFFSSSSADVVYLQYDFDGNIDLKQGSELLLFELKQGAE